MRRAFSLSSLDKGGVGGGSAREEASTRPHTNPPPAPLFRGGEQVIRKAMATGVALAVALLVPGMANAAPCTGPACNLDTLKPYFAKLATAAPAPGKRPVHIVQIGDSHTAGDVLTGAWRGLLQDRYGNGGRGVLAAGRPWAGYFTRGVTTAMTPGWSVAATFGPGSVEPRPPLGLASYLLRTALPGANIGLTADTPAMAFDRVVVCGLAGPGNGALTVRLGARVESVDFAANTATPRCRTITSVTPETSVTVTANGPAMLSSLATFRDNGGVALSNLGVSGSQLQHFARTDDALLGAELATYAPDLIVLAFGTNEGFSPRLDAPAYEATLRGQIKRLRRLSPDTPILLLGPPDALSRNPALRTNAAAPPLECPGLDTSSLFGPPALAVVRAIQRKVAGDLNLAFWDWQARMGGGCAARRWVENSALPLMRPDYVHFRNAGGQMLANALQADLDAAAKAGD